MSCMRGVAIVVNTLSVGENAHWKGPLEWLKHEQELSACSAKIRP